MVFKDYDYANENYVLDNGNNAVKIEKEAYIHERSVGKINNKKNIKKRKKLIHFLLRNNMMIIIGLIFVLGFIIISRDGKVYEMQNELSKISKNISSVISENEALEIKILKSISLDDIASAAKKRLNMVFPTKEDIINLDS